MDHKNDHSLFLCFVNMVYYSGLICVCHFLGSIIMTLCSISSPNLETVNPFIIYAKESVLLSKDLMPSLFSHVSRHMLIVIIIMIKYIIIE